MRARSLRLRMAEVFRIWCLLLAPFAPFFAAEMWEQMAARVWCFAQRGRCE